MNILKFESAGMTGTERNDVQNCRLRTRLKNNEGRIIYLEIGGTEASKYMTNPAGYRCIGRFDHCFFEDVKEDAKSNYSPSLHPIERIRFEYNQANILRLVNEKLNCSFDAMECSEELAVHDTDAALATSIK